MVSYTSFITTGWFIFMKQAMNATVIKRANQHLILDAIYRSGTTSRTQLAKDLQLSKPAISDNLQHLLELGIVDEIGESCSGPSGGRKSILLQFNPMHKYIISVNLNFSNPVFVLGNLDGEILNAFDISIAQNTPIQSCMELVNSSIHVLLQSLGANADKVYCIAAAAPGVYNEEGTLISWNPNCGGPAWWEINLKQELLSAFGLPVIVYNDVKAATLGEWVKGAGNNEPNLLYLSAGLGIGAGIILNGAPLLGERFNAGEIFDYIDSSNAYCGLNLEDTTCIEHLKEQCLRIPHSPFSSHSGVSLDAIIRAYEDGHPDVTTIIDGITKRLAVISYNYMTFISASHVVFGGEYAPFGHCFAKHLSQLFASKSRPVPNIKTSELGKYSGIQGMIYLAREQYFQEICFR